MLVLLSGCMYGKSPVEEIYEVLEEVVVMEKGFEEQQDPLVELEKDEKELYDKIISLGMKEFDEIVKLSDEALAIVDQRKEHMSIEQESIQNSQKEFQKIESLIEELEDQKVKDQANLLYSTMMQRYEIHDQLFKEYSKGLEYDAELYNLFKKEDITIEVLEEQITKINETYGQVLEENEKFNEATKQYNEIKLEFYKAAGLEIKEE